MTQSKAGLWYLVAFNIPVAGSLIALALGTSLSPGVIGSLGIALGGVAGIAAGFAASRGEG